MMMQMPRDMAPTRMASAVLCSCTIFFPKMIGRELVHHDERDDEDEYSETRNQCSDDIAERERGSSYLPPV